MLQAHERWPLFWKEWPKKWGWYPCCLWVGAYMIKFQVPSRSHWCKFILSRTNQPILIVKLLNPWLKPNRKQHLIMILNVVCCSTSSIFFPNTSWSLNKEDFLSSHVHVHVIFILGTNKSTKKDQRAAWTPNWSQTVCTPITTRPVFTLIVCIQHLT